MSFREAEQVADRLKGSKAATKKGKINMETGSQTDRL